MGAVTVIFIIPYLIIASVFGSIFGAASGTDRTKVELPYDESKGLVWEVDLNSTWFNLSKTEMEDGKQVFSFKGKSILSRDTDDMSVFHYIPVTFTAENGEEKVYMAKRDDTRLTFFHSVLIYSPEEYGMITVTPKSDLPVGGGEWYRYTESASALYKTETLNGEKAFTLIFVPREDGRNEFEEVFHYDTEVKGDYEQFLYYKIVLENGEATIKSETRKYEVKGEWTEVKPEIK